MGRSCLGIGFFCSSNRLSRTSHDYFTSGQCTVHAIRFPERLEFQMSQDVDTWIKKLPGASSAFSHDVHAASCDHELVRRTKRDLQLAGFSLDGFYDVRRAKRA